VNRALWLTAVAAALTALVVSFIHMPSAGSSVAPAQASVTLWVAGAQTNPADVTLARQVAAGWDSADQEATVAVLPGQARAAVGHFFDGSWRPNAGKENLLVLTSASLTQLSTRADGTKLLGHAPLVAVLASDPLELAVPAGSQLHSSAELQELLVQEPARRIFGLGADPWVRDSFALLISDWNLQLRRSYSAFDSDADAVAGLGDGSAQVVLAPRSLVVPGLKAHRLRLLDWPERRPAPAWVALAAPPGTSAAALARLRSESAKITASAQWRRALHTDGLTPVSVSGLHLGAFLQRQAAQARRLAALERRVIVR
jgi:tripartite-type tricarboxylate transporter receptor subunit TctC